MEKINSIQNEKVKSAAKLKLAKERAASGLFVTEGAKLTREAYASGFVMRRCFISAGASNALAREFGSFGECFIVTDTVMKKISSLTAPQDIIALFEVKDTVKDIYGQDFIIALDRVQDPSNLGAILRSAEAFGVKTVILSDECCDPYSSKALRAAMGGTFRLNVCRTDLIEYINKAKKEGYAVIGTGLDKSYVTVDKLCSFQKKIVVIGNEGGGISEITRDACDMGMFIPMYGGGESLNAAVAASIIMWENIRQKYE